MTSYKSVFIDGLNIFYREAGSSNDPTIILLHGFSSSSHCYRNLIQALSDRFHLIAPDYPGFGISDHPDVGSFPYTFDHLSEVIKRFLETLGINRFSLYLHGYGAPVGLEIASKNPESIDTLILQNCRIIEEGSGQVCNSMRSLWENRNEATEAEVLKVLNPRSIKSLYTHGARQPENINPDAWNMDLYFLSQPGVRQIQVELFYDYRHNFIRFGQWLAYLQAHQPHTLVPWGRNDPLFGTNGLDRLQRDLQDVEIHFLDTGHFALEEDWKQVADLITCFLVRRTKLPDRYKEYRQRCGLEM